MATSKIEWLKDKDGVNGVSWNPTVGCKKVSSGCKNCFAERMACRLAAMGRPEYLAVVDFGKWTGRVKCLPERLDQPIGWKKPRKIFVDSMSDLFHEDVPDSFIADVLHTVGHSYVKQHTFIVLTKRAERMMKFFLDNPGDVIPNLWLGVSAENQVAADERIPYLLKTPAAVRFASCEPLLSMLDISDWLSERAGCCGAQADKECSCAWQANKLDWVICGAESGPRARPFDIAWARDLRDQCIVAGVPFFLKQMPVDGKLTKMPFLDGRQWEEYPTCVRG